MKRCKVSVKDDGGIINKINNTDDFKHLWQVWYRRVISSWNMWWPLKELLGFRNENLLTFYGGATSDSYPLNGRVNFLSVSGLIWWLLQQYFKKQHILPWWYWLGLSWVLTFLLRNCLVFLWEKYYNVYILSQVWIENRPQSLKKQNI